MSEATTAAKSANGEAAPTDLPPTKSGPQLPKIDVVPPGVELAVLTKRATGNLAVRDTGWALSVVALPAFFFATGFIVISSNEERLGLVATDPGFFKAHYLQVGFLCSSFIAVLASMGFAQRHLGQRPRLDPAVVKEAGERVGYKPGFVLQMIGGDGGINPEKLPTLVRFFAGYPGPKNPDESVRFQGGHLILTLPVLLGLYLRLTICPPNTFQGAPLSCLLSFCFGTILLGTLSQKFGVRHRGGQLLPYLGILKLVPMTILLLGGLYLVSEICRVPWHNWESLPRWLWVGLVVLCIAWFLGRMCHRLVEELVEGKTSSDRPAWVALSLMLICFLYYTLATAYSAIWYPYIDLRKGGADYTNAPLSVVHFTGEIGKSLPKDFRDTETTSKPVILLLETSDTSYFAPASKDQNVWGKAGELRPERIYRLSKASILGITSTDQAPAATLEPSKKGP